MLSFMTLSTTFWIIMAVLMLVVAPVAMIYSMRQHFRQKASERPGGTGVGNAFLELDRLVARPSVEYVVEAETPTLKREDDSGGE
jgi:hypothetical protein